MDTAVDMDRTIFRKEQGVDVCGVARLFRMSPRIIYGSNCSFGLGL